MADGPLGGKTVLVVEDEMLIALDICDMLTEAGATVSAPCVSLEQALEAAQTAQIDLAVLDIDLNGQEVFPAAEVLRERGIPFVFYTGQPERETLATRFARVPVCVKPLGAQRLVATLVQAAAIAA